MNVLIQGFEKYPKFLKMYILGFDLKSIVPTDEEITHRTENAFFVDYSEFANSEELEGYFPTDIVPVYIGGSKIGITENNVANYTVPVFTTKYLKSIREFRADIGAPRETLKFEELLKDSSFFQDQTAVKNIEELVNYFGIPSSFGNKLSKEAIKIKNIFNSKWRP